MSRSARPTDIRLKEEQELGRKMANLTEYAGVCSYDMYEQMQQVSNILLHPLESLGLRTPKPLGLELGRGLRTLLGALKHRLAVVATDTPWFRDHLVGYSCAYLVPPGDVAGYNMEGFAAAASLAASHTKNSQDTHACTSSGPHNFTPELGIAAFADWLSQMMNSHHRSSC